MLTATNHVIAGPDLFRARPLALKMYFRNIFLPNIGEDQKKSFDFSSEPLAGTQARSWKFALGEGCFGGLGAGSQSPEANGG